MKRFSLWMFLTGMGLAGLSSPNTASALTCQQKCASVYGACRAAGGSYMTCQNDRAECLADC